MSGAERDAQIAAMAAEIRALQVSVSESQSRERSAQEAGERLEEYQNRVGSMTRMMEERGQVYEAKIRSLQTENEALRLHLRLALDSLRNPIEVPSRPGTAEGGREKEGAEQGEEEKENGVQEEGSYDSDEDEAYDSEDYEERHNEMQDHMHALLRDLGHFKRKIGDDKGRWYDVEEGGARRPLGDRSNV